MKTESYVDIFGNTVKITIYEKNDPKGYPARPGGGPPGETCKTCDHRRLLFANSKRFYKCYKMKHKWSHSPGTDIVLKTPACQLWEQSLSKTPISGHIR